MSINRVTLTSGPRAGKSYDVPAGRVMIDTPGGFYMIHPDGSQAWHPNEAATEPEPAAGSEETTCTKHKLTQSRDGKPKWCKTCGLDAEGNDQR